MAGSEAVIYCSSDIVKNSLKMGIEKITTKYDTVGALNKDPEESGRLTDIEVDQVCRNPGSIALTDAYNASGRSGVIFYKTCRPCRPGCSTIGTSWLRTGTRWKPTGHCSLRLRPATCSN
ncbi:hypothetical protein HPB51_019188 [Rhipicephalus microplus]|uniref:Uncharacterized protein n=1 Tax=Rhipicephalus microplus TaxID=6941 RepID=A0A9J6EB87_RHIMP|nr:hypothetical protein HPB51_019188 [Rhipicephalus microplus]